MITIEQIEHHRNGVGGAPFHVVTFTDTGATDFGGSGRMVGIVFEASEHVAVFDREKLGEGVIDFGANSWRGDIYEELLRAAIRRDRGARSS